MRFPPAREQALIAAIHEDADACLTFSPGDYRRADGAIRVSRDNLQELLHRRLYRLLVEPGLGRTRLTRECETWGCANPWHYRQEYAVRSVTHCRNGHEYTPENTTAAGYCRTCYADRVATRRNGKPDAPTYQRNKTHCPKGHPYTPDNTYTYQTPAGHRRKCKTCTRQQTADWRARHHT